jgi:hypothetical protein
MEADANIMPLTNTTPGMAWYISSERTIVKMGAMAVIGVTMIAFP